MLAFVKAQTLAFILIHGNESSHLTIKTFTFFRFYALIWGDKPAYIRWHHYLWRLFIFYAL